MIPRYNPAVFLFWAGQVITGYSPGRKRLVKTFTSPTIAEDQVKNRYFLDDLAAAVRARQTVPLSVGADTWRSIINSKSDEHC